MTDHLYTLVCDFRGGTYIAQVRAPDPDAAVRAWAAQIRETRPIPRASARVAAAMLGQDDSPTPLDGLRAVWCVSGLVGGSGVLLNIVQSD